MKKEGWKLFEHLIPLIRFGSDPARDKNFFFAFAITEVEWLGLIEKKKEIQCQCQYQTQFQNEKVRKFELRIQR